MSGSMTNGGGHDKANGKEPIVGKGQKVLAREERELPCRLSPEEVLQRADAAQKIYAERDRLVAEKKRAMEEINGRIKAEEGKLKLLFRQIRDRSEDRSVMCALVPDEKNNLVRVKREDTRQVVETREMRPHERQLELTSIDGGRAEKKARSKKANKPTAASASA